MSDSNQQLFETDNGPGVQPVDTEAIAESAGDRALSVASEQEDRRARSTHSDLGGGLSTTRSERILRHIQTARQNIEESRPPTIPAIDEDQRRNAVWDELKVEYARQDKTPTLLAYEIALYKEDPQLLSESRRERVENYLDSQDNPSTQIHTGPLL